jgi:hypothetical protein
MPKEMTMIEESKLSSTESSRRSLLQAAAVLGVAAPFLALSAESASAAKMSQAAVAYQNSPKGSQSCANCKLFVSPSTCKTVDGTVAANGWCKIWVKT